MSPTNSVGTLSLARQHELYLLPIMNESSDVFASSVALGPEKTAAVQNDADGFWIGVLDTATVPPVHELEQRLAEGVSPSLRGLLYLKTLQVRQKVDATAYDTLLTKARALDLMRSFSVLLDSFKINGDRREVLTVFNYYTNEVIGSTRLENSEERLPPRNFIIQVSRLIDTTPQLDKQEQLALLLKLNKVFVALNKDEFLFKATRAVEDLAPKVFLHITKQGIDLAGFVKRVLFNFFGGSLEDAVLLQILDFIVFEGFDFLIRVVVGQLLAKEEVILSVSGDELESFLDSKVWTQLSLTESISVQPDIIAYENLFHLLHGISLNRNNNELVALKEVNDDLLIKIHELKNQLSNLRTTHGEITDQNASYNEQLTAARVEKDRLTALHQDLQARYENLTMKENLKNTINANKDFSARNADLEAQIDKVRQAVADKKAKLAKLA